MDNRKISLCLTNYNRVELVFESFRQVIDDERISEIVISDDCSDLEIYQQIKGIVSALNALHGDKIKLFRTINNRDCYENKMVAISHATNDWCIIFDSDNVMDKSYLDRLYEIQEWDNNTAYMPSFAKPLFSYVAYEGVTLSKENIAEYIDKPMVSTCCNCMNYFINRNEYLKVWQNDITPHTADSLLQNYNWFKAGNKMLIVANLHYEHLVHDGSHYKNNVHKTGNLYQEITDKIKQLQ
jgi:glycosyltransferase involved in cell wall biosynthesis